MTGQLKLNKEMHDIQRFNDIYVRFDTTLSSISEIISVTRNHVQQLRLNMLPLGQLSPIVISPANLRQIFIRNCESITPES